MSETSLPSAMATLAPAVGPPPHVQVIQMAIAIWTSRAIYAAARLGVADHLADGARTAQELAQATNTHAPSLYRLLRALASRGLLSEVAPQRFALTPLGSALKTGAPGAARAAVLTLAGDWQWKAWDNFIYSLETGKPAIGKVFGVPLFEYLAGHAEDAARFDEAMVAMHGGVAPAVVAAYDFSLFRSVVDVGTGTLLTTILRAKPDLRGVLFELAFTAAQARKFVAAAGMADRCEVVEGDFFKSVPAGHDAYILSHVLHDWTDEQALPILRNCRQAIAPNGRLLIVETVLPQGDAPHHGKLLDLLMLTVTGGVERTADEYGALLSAAGFKLARVVPTSTYQSVVEATPA